MYLLFVTNFGHYYYYHYPQESARYWHAGMKDTIIASNSYSQMPLIFSGSFEPFLPFFLFYKPYKLNSLSISTHLKEINNSSFSGQILDNKYYFGRINWSNLSELPPNSLFIVPKSEFDNQTHPNFARQQLIKKQYLNQEEFYLLTDNE